MKTDNLVAVDHVPLDRDDEILVVLCLHDWHQPVADRVAALVDSLVGARPGRISAGEQLIDPVGGEVVVAPASPILGAREGLGLFLPAEERSFNLLSREL